MGDIVHVQLVRHGKSVAQEQCGAARLAESMRDAPISSAGRKQAECLAQSIRSTAGAGEQTIIVSSPLTRALQTAAILRKGSALTNEKIQIHPGLAEHGACMPENQGRSVANLSREQMFVESVDFSSIDDSSWPGTGGCLARLAEFARWLAEQQFAHVVVVSHKMTIEALLQGLHVKSASSSVQNCVPILVALTRSELQAFAVHAACSAPAASISTEGCGVSAKAGAPTSLKGARKRMLIVLAGLPGSGKSTFARALVGSSSSSTKYVTVSSDDDGRGWSLKLNRELQQTGQQHVILDRVNPTRAGRQDVVRQARGVGATQKKSSSSPTVGSDLLAELVYFDVSADECEKRALYRTLTSGHPTVKAGKEAKAIAGAANVLEPPGHDNDGFSRVHRVQSGRDAFVAFCAIRGCGDALPEEVRHQWLGKLECGRALVYYPPTDSSVVRCVRDLQIAMSRKDASGYGGPSGEAARSPLVTGAILLKDVHVTVVSPTEMKACAVSGETLAGVAQRFQGLAEEFAEMSDATTDGVPRLASAGSKRTAFFVLQQQGVWRKLGMKLLSAASSPPAGYAGRQPAKPAGMAEELSLSGFALGNERDFHVSFWNQVGEPHESIGGLNKGLDKNGANFIQMFGALPVTQDWSTDEEVLVASTAAASLHAEAASYKPREMALTDEELRRGNTCRRPCGEVECQFKFPRTFHILDTGNMEADDLLLDVDEANLFLGKSITVEEKVDGANIGISLDPEETASDGRPAFRFQKRSHFVTVASELQFRGLDAWAHENRGALLRVLESSFGTVKPRPGQRIVFGEWLAATHSKAYDNLPSRFILFDIFDAELREGRGGFLSARNRDRLLARVNARVVSLAGDDPSARLWRVRAVCTGRTFGSAKELLDVMNSEAGKSVYIKGGDESRRRVEGVYLRVDDDATGLLHARAKLVHPAFHRMLEEGRWEGGAKNTVRHDLWWGRDHDAVEASLAVEDDASG